MWLRGPPMLSNLVRCLRLRREAHKTEKSDLRACAPLSTHRVTYLQLESYFDMIRLEFLLWGSWVSSRTATFRNLFMMRQVVNYFCFETKSKYAAAVLNVKSHIIFLLNSCGLDEWNEQSGMVNYFWIFSIAMKPQPLGQVGFCVLAAESRLLLWMDKWQFGTIKNIIRLNV